MTLPKKGGTARPAGQIRQSQIVTTFGPGAMVDLTDHAVIVAGLDHWTGYKEFPVHEERLAAKVKTLLGVPSIEFYSPPPDKDDPTADVTGITAWLFPEWFIAQYEEKNPETGMRSRPLVHRLDLRKGQLYERDKKRYKVVPVRFVQACLRGHVSDIDWRVFVHGKEDKCQRSLWIEERGTSGDLTDITIRCECGKFKALSAATKLDDVPLGHCNGPRPWLGNFARERCGGGDGSKAQFNKLLIRSASNAYFAQTLSVISIPEPGGALGQAVDSIWLDFLQYAESEADVARERKKQKVSAALEGCSDQDVWKDIQRRKAGGPPAVRGIREAEIETLLSSPGQAGEDQPESLFHARTIPIPNGQPALTRHLSKVVKIHRLREVIAQVGFTRFESAVADIDGELALDVERAALSLNQTWVPAVENRGEGIFLAIDPGAMHTWLARSAVKARGEQLLAGFEAWKKARPGLSSATFPGLPYVMLHSLSHLLITAVSLDCGYAASSIRERIYVGGAGHGILLYTASPDAEGTLGGLVQAADRIDNYLAEAVELGKLCANDPVCAQHRPESAEEERFLLGAACHGCLLLAESSCERRNDFLDRGLIVATVDSDGGAFFTEV